jgi:peptide/nickel transport system permease protein
LMQDAQNLRTLGQTPWIMAPALFIIMAVLGFNLLGDGLRDAADPYSVM